MTVEVMFPRWRELLTKTFVGRGSRGQLQVLDDIMPVMPVIDPSESESHYPRGEQLWGWTNATPAVAGQYPTLMIGNDSTAAGSPRLVVVESLRMINTTAASVLCIAGKGANTATLHDATNLDGRWNAPGAAVPTKVAGVATNCYSTVTNLLPVVNFLSAQVPANSTFELFNMPIACILTPGEAFIAQLQTFNIACYFQVSGYVRQLDPSELL
jgi:hypothetical protein